VGHTSSLARIHGTIDKEKVIAKLLSIKKKHSELEGKIVDAISDIEMFASSNSQ